MTSLAYVGVRPETGAADAEYASFRRGLGGGELARIDLLDAPLSDDELTRFTGFVIGGSPFNVTDQSVSALQRRVERDLERIAERALTGAAAAMFTCYGIGVVTRMLGGAVHTRHPEAASAALIQTTDAADTDPVFGPGGRQFAVFTAHKESSSLPEQAELLATNAACPVHAYRVGATLYATQFHPEPTPADFAGRMEFYRSTGYFDAAAFDSVRDRILGSDVTEGHALLARFAAETRSLATQ